MHWRIWGGRAGARPPHGTQFFCFCIHFHQKVPTSEVHTPPMGTRPPYGKSWICHCTGADPGGAWGPGPPRSPKMRPQHQNSTKLRPQNGSFRPVTIWGPPPLIKSWICPCCINVFANQLYPVVK